MQSAIALVFAPYNRNSIAALAGALETTPSTQRLPVAFLRHDGDLPRDIEELGLQYERVIVGFSFGSFDIIESAKQLWLIHERLTPEHLQKTFFVAGGPHASGCHEELLQIGFDFAVVGEGERSFPALVEAVFSGQDVSRVRGVAWKRGDACVLNAPDSPVDLDRYPPFSVRHGVFSAVEMTRGCPMACNFCQVSGIFGRRFRHRSPEGLERAALALRDSGRRDLRFVSPNSLAYGAACEGERRLDVIEQMLRRTSAVMNGGRIYFGTFPSEIWPQSVSEEALGLIRKYAANNRVIVGAQSGSDRVLRLMDRRHTVGDVRKAVGMILSMGFGCDADFILGYPGEVQEDRESTIRFMNELVGQGARAHVHVFAPLVGTPLANEMPVRLEKDVEREVDRLASRRSAFGSWRRQQETFHKVHEFRKALRNGTMDGAISRTA